MEETSIGVLISGLGFAIGIIFGATAQRTNFCTMGALSDIVFMNDWSRLRAWLLAISIAILVSQMLHINGLIDLNKSIYLNSNLGWAGAIIGGLMFGFGMTIAGGCGNKTLVRFGAGNLKSLIVFMFMGIFAYMTLRGFIGPARQFLESHTIIDLKQDGFPTQGISDLLAKFFKVNEQFLRLLISGVISLTLFIFCFKDQNFRNSPKNILAGCIIGTLIPLAWFITGVIGKDDFDPTPLASFSFVAPSGNSIQYLMTFTGSTIDFGIATVGGVILGSFLMSKLRGEFRVESFTSTDDFMRHVLGASMMGVGGVLALGCTIGQGVTGVSTLALGSLIALSAILVGGIFGLKYLEEENIYGALKAMIPTTNK
jgi:uncharacterized membrane protein YedE/YeeE